MLGIVVECRSGIQFLFVRISELRSWFNLLAVIPKTAETNWDFDSSCGLSKNRIRYSQGNLIRQFPSLIEICMMYILHLVTKLCTKFTLDIFVLHYLIMYKGAALAVIRRRCTIQTYVSR
jgi:hypothetical protein